MKQLILLLASLLPIAGMAAEAGDTTIVVKGKNVVIPDSVISSLLSKSEAAPHVNDTTIVVNGKDIVVSDSAGLTKVSVFGKEGEKLNRIYETSYTNGQEVQRVYDAHGVEHRLCIDCAEERYYSGEPEELPA